MKTTKSSHADPHVDPHDHLRSVDTRLAKVIERHGPSPLYEQNKAQRERATEATEATEATDEHFAGLVRAIVSQQLSGKAADTIYGRVLGLWGGALPAPAAIVATSDERLRSAGLSGAKTRGVKDLAERVASGALSLAALGAEGDEAVIEALTKVRGIGRWTAEMFMIFRLGRLDVLSTGDLGLRKGMMHLFGLPDLPDPKRMEELAGAWKPFRAIASWYLWRVAEESPPHRTAGSTKKKAAAKAKAAAAKKPETKKKAAVAKVKAAPKKEAAAARKPAPKKEAAAARKPEPKKKAAVAKSKAAPKRKAAKKSAREYHARRATLPT